ncbi:MAG: NADH-quinone oxidoreductase subunit H [Kiritimatiellae bacterium]|nr:NADH-quinone oxidoreductase subunit H [Kiritimatiellia bacterium]
MNVISITMAVVLAPLFIGIVNQTKAFFAGKKGPGLFRLYADIWKLLGKSRPRHRHSTWVFEIAQPLSLASVLVAAIIFPWNISAGSNLPVAVPVALFFYLLGSGRFFAVLGALDAGNAFEGMGASREVQFSALVEPVLFVSAGFLALLTGETALSGILGGVPVQTWLQNIVPLVLAAFAFTIAFLSENCRVPFDDPETHLELTMIHEAMLLDVGGPDLAFALYGAALKFEVLAAFLMMAVLPSFSSGWIRLLFVFIGIGTLSVSVGAIESAMARMRFLKAPQALMGATLVAALAVFLFVFF